VAGLLAACAFDPCHLAIAWPLWAYRREHLMLLRRLLLAGATTEAGRLRRWFWRGRLLQSLAVVTALLWAGAMLLVAAQLKPLQWLILTADAVLLGNTLVLVAAFVAHDYALGFADTRALSWNALAAQTMQSAQAGAACPTAGALLGLAALADQLPRHTAMLLLPGLPDPRARVLAWLLLLAATGFGSCLFTRYVLGVEVLLESRTQQAASEPGLRPGLVFMATSLASLALAGLWAAYGPRLGIGAAARPRHPCRQARRCAAPPCAAVQLQRSSAVNRMPSQACSIGRPIASQMRLRSVSSSGTERSSKASPTTMLISTTWMRPVLAMCVL
jgi:hypothetical protein